MDARRQARPSLVTRASPASGTAGDRQGNHRKNERKEKYKSFHGRTLAAFKRRLS
jgi:hypothetical protein